MVQAMSDPAFGPPDSSPAAVEVAPLPPPPLAIAVRGLRKLYGNKAAVDGLDLAVPAGAFFGFLGPNGAGKTTTIKMLMGLATPSAGSINILGLPVPERSLDI